MRKLFYSIVPLSNSFREGEIKGVSYKKRKDNVKKHLYILVPLSNSIREGEIKGVSKNKVLVTKKFTLKNKFGESIKCFVYL